MSGTLSKRKTSWCLEYMYKGNRYSKTIPFYEAKTEKKARLLLEEFCIEIRKGDYVDLGEFTFEDVALMWLEKVAKPNYSPITTKHYIINLNNHTIPFFKHKKISDITPLMITDFINSLQTKNTMYEYRNNKPLKNESIRTIYKTFHVIMKYAYNNDIIKSNPCDKVTLQLPKEVMTEKHYYNKDEYHKLLDLLKTAPLDKQVAIELALKTGMRRSEIYGLKWQDIDLDNKVIACNKTRQKIDNSMRIMATKTASSIRTISIPNSLVELLRKYKTDTEFVLNDDYDNLTAWWRNWTKRNGLPHIKFHDLRHTHATLLLCEGVDIKTIQKRLGHSDIKTTLNTYAHVLEELDQKASNVFDEI